MYSSSGCDLQTLPRATCIHFGVGYTDPAQYSCSGRIGGNLLGTLVYNTANRRSSPSLPQIYGNVGYAWRIFRCHISSTSLEVGTNQNLFPRFAQVPSASLKHPARVLLHPPSQFLRGSLLLLPDQSPLDLAPGSLPLQSPKKTSLLALRHE